jgi:hypothetical protein
MGSAVQTRAAQKPDKSTVSPACAGVWFVRFVRLT